MSNEKKIIGKRRFSKVERTTYTSETSPADAFEQHGRPNGEGGYVIGRSFPDSIAGMVQASKRLLQASSLPYEPRLFWVDKSDQWQSDRPADFCKIQKAAWLDAHIIDALGYCHDSPEGVAARIIYNADRMAHLQGDEANEAAFRLGELKTLAKVYGIESVSGRKGGKSPKRSQWADAVAQYLLSNYEGMKKDEIWDALGDRANTFEVETDFGDVEFYKDGDTLCAKVDGGSEETLGRKHFFNEYLKTRKPE